MRARSNAHPARVDASARLERASGWLIVNARHFIQNVEMSIQSIGTSIGRPRRLQSIQDRAARLQALQFCSSRVGKILQQYSDWFEDESLPIKQRMHAGDRLLAYALGKPTTFESPEVGEVKQTLIVRWMPPDPNDRSNVIEQEPD
jgi:hypothetical protein